jgi:hypothetical protein
LSSCKTYALTQKKFLIGNLTRDPHLRYAPKGAAIAEIGLAINRVSTDEGQKKNMRKSPLLMWCIYRSKNDLCPGTENS